MTKADKERLTFAMLWKRSGLTQTELAQRIQVRRATVSSWVGGHTTPNLTPAQTKLLLTELNCSLDELIEACQLDQGKEG